MSDIHPGKSLSKGLIQHSNQLCNDIGELYLNEAYSDIKFKVKNQTFYGHKVILAARSQYFRALLYGGLKESHEEVVVIKDTSLVAFKALLKYIYTGTINLKKRKDETVMSILCLAHQYGFEELELAICEYLKDTLSENSVCLIYDMALLYNLNSLTSVCLLYMDKHAETILQNESFTLLSQDAMTTILQRDSFYASEIAIFKGVSKWIENNKELPKETTEKVLNLVRLPLITLPDLLTEVRLTGLLSPDQILDAIKVKNEKRDMELQYRGLLIPNKNVALVSRKAYVLTGELKGYLLNGHTNRYDFERGFTRHAIDDNFGEGILIDLGERCILNHFQMLLWDKDNRAYSYYIEVSVDKEDWVTLINHRKYLCRSWQKLYFRKRVIQYIRIVGTHNTINRIFHLVAFEAYYTEEKFKLRKGIIVPEHNVALESESAMVIEGVSRKRNNLLWEANPDYDWDSGYTCHQINSGAIVIQLGQPYWLSSCQLLLWDCDDRSYRYYIEASTNGTDWKTIVDKTSEDCQSWQTCYFTPCKVLYFKIVGTYNSANEVFHCVRFLSPAEISSDKKDNKLAVQDPLNPSNALNLPLSLSPHPETSSNNDSDVQTSDYEHQQEGDGVIEGHYLAPDDAPPSESDAQGNTDDGKVDSICSSSSSSTSSDESSDINDLEPAGIALVAEKLSIG